MRIEDIDKNFAIKTEIKREDIVFLDAKKEPFDIYGAYEPFVRLPGEIAENTNKGVFELYKNTAGIRVRFATDSPYVAISAKLAHIICQSKRMPYSGIAGFDMYEYKDGKYKYLKTFEPIIDETEKVEDIYDFKTQGKHDILINFPLYNGVEELYIGVKEDCNISHSAKYKNEKPWVFYGSSITQGCCASRPGAAYQAILSREFDADFINLGFSGNALGEEVIANYIASLEMSMFFLDYDHNAPSAKSLDLTHERFFKIVREKHPDLPIIMLSMPFPDCVNDANERRRVIEATYNNAIKSGDKNVYFIDGSKMPEIFGNENGTVDGVHPNDLGFMCMAKGIEEVIKNII